ncbi:hypothetical protein OH77DRAFT_1423699 [Trametes cingulata]|nr:hypothetical protein OH77DRAFT_1423699 [Trametes cingulata]
MRRRRMGACRYALRHCHIRPPTNPAASRARRGLVSVRNHQGARAPHSFIRPTHSRPPPSSLTLPAQSHLNMATIIPP